LENVKTSKAELDKTARQLKDSLESIQQSSSAKGYERMKTNFINTSLKVRANHIAFLCENLDKTIKEMKLGVFVLVVLVSLGEKSWCIWPRLQMLYLR